MEQIKLPGAENGLSGSSLAKPTRVANPPWWDYPKFHRKEVRVLLVSTQHLLLSEIRGALTRLGHGCQILLLEGKEFDPGTVESRFTETIHSSRPDFVLTINHLGFDQEGFVTGLLTRYRIPFASWYVDSPHLIIRHYARNRSPYLTLFLWDKDYVEVVRQLGFDRAEYLPLGVDETLFKPLNPAGNPLSPLATDVSFVGNSMRIKVRSALGRSQVLGPLIDHFETVSIAFQQSHRLIVREMMAEQFPSLDAELRNLPEPRALAYETAVTWHATGLYRLSLVKRLRPFHPRIIGDGGWGELLNGGFQLHRELNYYSDLTAFYNVSRVSFNATSRQMKNGVNQRVFDVPACRRVAVTDWTPQLEDLMEPGVEILAYRTGDEVPEGISRVLRDEAFRKKISEAGYRRVLGEHTYVHRLREMIRVMRRNSASLP